MALYLPHDPRGKNQYGEMRRRAFEATVRIQREVDDGLRVVWDDEREKFIILDTKAPGGPDASYVMIVQEPDGSFRDIDQRTLDTLRYLFDGHRRVKEELARLEAERERETQKRRASYGDRADEVFKYAGHVITPTVESRNRTRQAIREAAL